MSKSGQISDGVVVLDDGAWCGQQQGGRVADGRRREVHCLCSSSLPLHAPTRRGYRSQCPAQHAVRILSPAHALHPAPCTGAGLSGSGAQGSIRSATLDGHTYAVKTFSRRAASAANTERSAVRAALACGAGARLGGCTYAPLTHAHATSPPHRQQASRLGSATPVHAHVTAVTHARALPSGEVQLFMEHGVCDLHTARCALPRNRYVLQAPAGSWPDAAGALPARLLAPQGWRGRLPEGVDAAAGPCVGALPQAGHRASRW